MINYFRVPCSHWCRLKDDFKDTDKNKKRDKEKKMVWEDAVFYHFPLFFSFHKNKYIFHLIWKIYIIFWFIDWDFCTSNSLWVHIVCGKKSWRYFWRNNFEYKLCVYIQKLQNSDVSAPLILKGVCVCVGGGGSKGPNLIFYYFQVQLFRCIFLLSHSWLRFFGRKKIAIDASFSS